MNYMDKVIGFLKDIGLDVRERSISEKTFSPFILIENGVLFIQSDKATVANVLHEAGHIALCPEPLRNKLNGNLYKSLRFIFNCIKIPLNSDLHWYLMAMDDPSVSAWAWAVGKHLDIPDEIIIEDADYDNHGAEVRMMLQLKGYFGINSLHHAGYCNMPRNPNANTKYPSLNKWIPMVTEKDISYIEASI